MTCTLLTPADGRTADPAPVFTVGPTTAPLLSGDDDGAVAPPGAGRILLLGDRPDATRLSAVLARVGGFTVLVTSTPTEAISALMTDPWDLLLAEPGVAGGRGGALLRHARTALPGTAVAALVDAGGPVAPDGVATVCPADDDLEVLSRVDHLIDAARSGSADAAPDRAPETVLAVGVHLADVVSSIGGILRAHRAAGDTVVVLSLTRGDAGSGAADGSGPATGAPGHPDLGPGSALGRCRAAADLLGVDVRVEHLDDALDGHGRRPVDRIQRMIEQVGPTTVYTHSIHDDDPHHRSAFLATVEAARKVRHLACFEGPTTTAEFRPDRYVAVGTHVDRKRRALEALGAPDAQRPRLPDDDLGTTARYWGRFGHSQHVEALETVRDGTVSVFGALLGPGRVRRKARSATRAALRVAS